MYSGRTQMNKRSLRLIWSIVICYAFSFCPNNAFADVNLPWSTTYNCNDWTQSMGLFNVNCDGLTGYGGWTTVNGAEEQITAAANNPAGGGGKGQRHWAGDGPTNNSGGLRIVFLTHQPELWVRWYMRYELGFQWNPLIADKWLYFDSGQPQAVVPEWYGSDKLNIWSNTSGNHAGATDGWTTTMGGPTSDGKWRLYEVHLKMDTDGTNGIGEIWIDGVKKLSYTNINYGTQAGWLFFALGSNKGVTNNGRDMYIDYDDVSVSATGYIGPLPTSAPKNLQVK